MSEMVPRSLLYRFLYEKTPAFELIRLSGDRSAIERELASWSADPGLELVYREKLQKCFKIWTVLVAVHLVAVENPAQKKGD